MTRMSPTDACCCDSLLSVLFFPDPFFFYVIVFFINALSFYSSLFVFFSFQNRFMVSFSWIVWIAGLFFCYWNDEKQVFLSSFPV